MCRGRAPQGGVNVTAKNGVALMQNDYFKHMTESIGAFEAGLARRMVAAVGPLAEPELKSYTRHNRLGAVVGKLKGDASESYLCNYCGYRISS